MGRVLWGRLQRLLDDLCQLSVADAAWTARAARIGQSLNRMCGKTRVATLDQVIEEVIPNWHFALIVDALRALRGVNSTIAATVVAEVGDITRFENPRQRMAWLGLVPSEHSSGNTTRRGRLTKTGNALACTMLVEAGWSYRHPPKEGHPYLKRSAHLPQEIKDIGWKAQIRLYKRYRHLSNAGKPQPRVLAAIARELSGFVWDIVRKTPLVI